MSDPTPEEMAAIRRRVACTNGCADMVATGDENAPVGHIAVIEWNCEGCGTRYIRYATKEMDGSWTNTEKQVKT